MNDQLSINGSIKDNLFNKLKSNKTVKHLEISYGNVDDDWHLIGELNELVSLSIKDSFIDFHSFYGALAKLKNLEQITYNYYCFFNKQKNDQLKNIIINIKTFQIDFPKDDEPDFDFNNYLKETYKKKFHSIFEIKNCDKIFLKLEEVIFTNYQKFKTLVKEFDSTEKKLFEKILYWGMEPSKLKKFKSLKNIEINEGKYLDLLELGLENYLIDMSKKKVPISFNRHNKILDEYPSEINILEFIYQNHSDDNKTIPNLNFELKKIIEGMHINTSSLTINESKLFKNANYNKPFKLLNNKKISKILNHNFENIVFSNSYNFLNHQTTGENGIKKSELYVNLLDKQKNIKNIFFDISISKNDYDNNWEYFNFSFLIKFIYEINKKFPKIRFFLFHSEISKLLDNGQSSDNFEIHLAYLINSLEINNLNNKVTFLNAKKEKLDIFLKKYIQKGIDQIVVIDDFFYEAAKTLPGLALIYGEEIEDIRLKFSKYNEQSYRLNKLNTPLKTVFNEILRIASFGRNNFKSDNSKLTMLVKKNYLKNVDNLQFKKLFYYLGSPLHLITQNMSANATEWKLDKKLELSNPDNPDEINIIKNKNLSFAKQSMSQISNSTDIDSNELNISDSMYDANNFEIINDVGIDKNKILEISHCWFEGVNTWQQKYIRLSEFDKIIPINNLENLRLSDCIYFDDLEIPLMPKLKVLELSPHQNHHQTKKFREISKFENCPNLEKLIIENLNNFYNKKNYNISLGSYHIDYKLTKNDTFSIINLDLSKLHELKKLKYLDIHEIQASDIRKIKYLSNLNELKLKIFHNTTDDYLSDYEPEPEVSDNDLLFLKESKKIKNIDLSIGDDGNLEDSGFGQCYSSYGGNGGFIDYINYKIENLTLSINFDFKNQIKIQDIITKITNRFLNLKKLDLTFGIAVTKKNFSQEENKYFKKLDIQTIDFSKFTKLKKLINLSFQIDDDISFIKFKTINFDSLVRLKKIKELSYCWTSISFSEFRKARIALKNENYEDPEYYDLDYKYNCEDIENYKKNWSRLPEINTMGDWDWYSLEERYLKLEKIENEKKFKKTTIIKKKS
tara:strand:+ start:1013 stop:4237 length:3225 start_codon:yes stop_codon:yes gene_type:complete